VSENNHVIDLLPAYVLNALDPAEAVQVEAHLEECVECREEMESFQLIAGDLALAVPSRQPPAGLREHILNQVQGGLPAPLEAGTTAGSFDRLKNWLYRLAPAWGLVSLALVIFLVASNLSLRQQLGQPKSMGEFRVIAMLPTDRAPDASGVLVISGDGMDGTLVVENLPDLEKAYQYQLWLIRDGQRTSGGVFSIEADGYGYLVVTSHGSLLGYDAFGVTIEPYGGSLGPTGDKVMGGEL